MIAFQDDDTYAESVLCQLEGGGLGAEVYGGTYEAQGGEVTLTQTLGTCDVDPLVVAVSYELDGDTLIMGSDEQVKQLKRVDKDSDTPAQVTYGCYAQDGSFTPSPIRDL